jgi:hypothetical protein
VTIIGSTDAGASRALGGNWLGHLRLEKLKGSLLSPEKETFQEYARCLRSTEDVTSRQGLRSVSQMVCGDADVRPHGLPDQDTRVVLEFSRQQRRHGWPDAVND